ncbi:hypothetical protein SynSYN20_03197 [Synechococcus sp. SYN20]|nr:hypothetical protein SynSYN20_03197 [Synechococcus sp. SYN20]
MPLAGLPKRNINSCFACFELNDQPGKCIILIFRVPTLMINQS